jgi:hypothetical protein
MQANMEARLYIIIYVLSEPEKGLIVSVRAVYSSVPENM